MQHFYIWFYAVALTVLLFWSISTISCFSCYFNIILKLAFLIYHFCVSVCVVEKLHPFLLCVCRQKLDLIQTSVDLWKSSYLTRRG